MNARDAQLFELVKSLQQDFEILEFAAECGPRAARKAVRRYCKGHRLTLVEIVRVLQGGKPVPDCDHIYRIESGGAENLVIRRVSGEEQRQAALYLRRCPICGEATERNGKQ